MKKLVALLLMLGLLLTCVPAFALETSDVFGSVDSDDAGSWGPPYNHSEWKKMVGVDLKQGAKITAKVYDESGKLFNTLVDGEQYGAGYLVINWPAVNEEGWHAGKGEHVTYDLEITAEIDGETVTLHVPYDFYYAHDFADHEKYKVTWYPHNTICVAGIEFRKVRPELTSKWYNFAAIDLSADGVQTFDLVASNKYIIGTVTVTKFGDEVTVDWDLRRQGTNDANFKPEREFLTFFSDLNAVTEVEPDKFEGPTYEFGKPISIANDLGGDTNVLLYICNQATYCNNLSYEYKNPIYHAEYWPNLKWRIAVREAMMELVNADLGE